MAIDQSNSIESCIRITIVAQYIAKRREWSAINTNYAPIDAVQIPQVLLVIVLAFGLSPISLDIISSSANPNTHGSWMQFELVVDIQLSSSLSQLTSVRW